MQALTRRAFLVSALSAPLVRAASRPNLLLILADDLGSRDTGFQGGDLPTPNIDRIAREGVRFTQFSCFPLCTPSRAALLTGRNPVRYGLIYSVIRPWSGYGLPQDELLLSEAFQRAGYGTATIGKWHLGHAHAAQLPNRRGFDHFYGYVNAEIDHFEHTKLGGLDWQRNGKGVREKGYSAELLGNEAVRWLESRDRRRPFFLYLPFDTVHAPMQAPEAALRAQSHIANPRRRVLAAMLSVMDQQIGRVLTVLDRQGIANDTLVVFLSDNGGAPGQGASNQPYRAGKLTAYEGGLHVPAAMRWPGVLPAGRNCDSWMTVLDLFPTLAAAAGVPVSGGKPFDGQNYWEAIRNGRPFERGDFFVACKRNETLDRQFALRSGPWKIVEIVNPKDVVTTELYRLDRDPGEQNNLAAREPETLDRLRRELERWRKLHPRADIDSSMNPHPGWIPPADYAQMPASYPAAASSQ